MDGIALLRALAAQADRDIDVEGLDSGTLRFVIEYPSEVSVLLKIEEIGRGLDMDGFQFFPLFADPGSEDVPDHLSASELGEFYVLQFPGLERTLDNRSLFSIAHELQRLLGAITVEPDLGSVVYREPASPETAPENVMRDVFLGTCLVAADPPPNHEWALDRAGVLGAWSASTARGAGIRIAQPDTGVTDHTELSDVSMSDGFNVLNGTSDPTDPLSGDGNTGHGTATASVMTSGPRGLVHGPSPKATLVPIRCIESVILAFNGSAVAKAIDHARMRECHIVTMSLGGTPSRAMKKAIERAIQSDMIVLAAAGNCVGLVVYPARYDEVIAVAGSNVDNATWTGSCHGPAVDISAPGENVWKAIAGPGGADVGAGQGTSFAVAITAGVAALWLSHHGPSTVKEEAKRRQISVQALFREVLISSARPPQDWLTDEFGSGVIDAKAVLQRTLDGPISPMLERASVDTTSDMMGLLTEAWGPDEASKFTDVASQTQFQLELSSVVLEDARLGVDPPNNVGAEASLTRQDISPQLESALGVRAAARGHRPTITSVYPSLRADRIQSNDPVILVASSHSALEAAADLTPEAARESLSANSEMRLGALEERVGRVRANAEREHRATLKPVHDQLLKDSEVVLERLRKGVPIPNELGVRTALEALVQLEGRPALRLRDDGVDPNDPELGAWQGAVVLHPTLAERQRSVGRIDTTSGVHVGTGFVVGDELIMTNRHVLEALAFPVPRRSNPSGWVLDGEPVVNFSPSGTDAARSFRIDAVVFSGPDPIAGRIDLAHLDLALLRVERTNVEGEVLPPPLNLSNEAITPSAAKVFVIGYPAMPTRLPLDKEGKLRLDVVHRLREIFDMKYGEKYLSPGLVLTSAGEISASPKRWVFTHDATSLGGNSGSCVLSFDHDLDVAGLHFAGDWLRANYAHAIDKVMTAIPGFVP